MKRVLFIVVLLSVLSVTQAERNSVAAPTEQAAVISTINYSGLL